MGLVKDAVGVVVSATITGGLFLGPAILGILFGVRPLDMIDVLASPERTAVVHGAWVQSPVEVEGELDGTVTEPEDADPDDPSEATEERPPKPAADGPPDPDGSGPAAGEADVAAKPESKAGTSAGERGPRSDKPGYQPPTNRKPQARSKRECAPSYEGIRRRPDGTYEVARSLVNYHTASVSQFNELGWSQPNDKGDGKGWFISGFGCNDPLWHGGLRRGDVVLTVNGKKTNNMMQVLLLYTKVKAQSHFEVEIIRKGRPITLKYDIVRG